MIDLTASVVVTFGGEATTVKFSVSTGSPEDCRPESIAIASAKQGLTSIMEQLVDPEVQDLKQAVYDHMGKGFSNGQT